MRRSVTGIRSAARLLSAFALQLAALAACALAQSGDPDLPAPVLTNEIAGRIAPLDVGDSRRTRHFYTFGAQPGDLELTVESDNLEGDVDVFTAATLRPLAKVTLYAGLGSPVSRTVYFRRAESLVLRVQARSPNDAEGSYRIRLGGTFVAAAAPAAGEARPDAVTPAEAAAARPADRKGRRVSSVGARIEEPKTEVAAETIRPDEDVRAPESAAPTPTPSARRTGGRARPAAREGARTESARRGGAARNRQTRPPAGESEAKRAAREEAAPAETPEAAPARPAARTGRTRPPRTSRARTGAGVRAPAEPAKTGTEDAASSEASAPTGLELPGTRLVLELREGGRLEREMSGVRRVTVERGVIVILLRNGQVERQPLSNVLRMSIEP